MATSKQQPEPTKTVSYDIHVVGKLWSGAQSACSYTAAMWRAVPGTVEALKRLAGDFSEITDYEVVQHVSWHEKIESGYRSINEDTVVMPWKSEESEELWERLSG